MEEADGWIREWACEQGAPTPYRSASNVQQVPFPLPPHTQNAYFDSGGRVSGYKTAATSFDGDGIHRLAIKL